MMSDDKAATAQTTDATSAEAGSTQQVQPAGETLEQLRESLAKTTAALKDANKEAAARRNELNKLTAEKTAKEEAEKTEAQKLADRATKAEQERDAALSKARSTLIRAEVTSAAARLQFRDPGDVLKMIDADKLEVGEDGTIANLEDQLKKLADAKPYLLSTSIIGGMTATMPAHSGAQATETYAQKRTRILGGIPTDSASLGGGYIPSKKE